jgi:hypothetical protein
MHVVSPIHVIIQMCYKMELALFIRREKDIGFIENPNSSRFYNALDQKVLDLINNQGFNRLYFGTESCENCMPNVDSVRKAKEIALKKGIAFTLVTPVCTEYGIDYLANHVLQHINNIDVEITSNDFGVFHMLSQMGFKGDIVMGRMLAKSKKWPLGDVPDEFKESLSHSPFGLIEYQEYLHNKGVSVIELDNRIEGYNFDLDKLPFNIGLHMPFVYLTSGRMCFLSGQEKNNEERFGIIKGCKRYCDSQTVRLNNQFYSNGRAVYGVNNNIENLEKHKIDRLIISPNI